MSDGDAAGTAGNHGPAVMMDEFGEIDAVHPGRTQYVVQAAVEEAPSPAAAHIVHQQPDLHIVGKLSDALQQIIG